MRPNLTFDTGALIAWERKQLSLSKIVALATEEGRRISVPEIVIAEWWRGYDKRRAEILRSVVIDPLTTHQAKVAGEALAALAHAGGGASLTIDAVVMASAASRGDIVYTSDPNDLVRLQQFFPSVKTILHP